MIERTPRESALTDLILETFRLNADLKAAGEKLTHDLGVTGSRWLLLSVLAMANEPLTVAQAARRMALKRQSVQRIADVLAEDGLLTYQPNPNDRRAKLMRLSQRGNSLLRELGKRQSRWANRVAGELDANRINRAVQVLRDVRDCLKE